jgi:hypothetical protein
MQYIFTSRNTKLRWRRTVSSSSSSAASRTHPSGFVGGLPLAWQTGSWWVQSRSSRRRPLAATHNSQCHHRALQVYQMTQSKAYTVSWITNENLLVTICYMFLPHSHLHLFHAECICDSQTFVSCWLRHLTPDVLFINGGSCGTSFIGRQEKMEISFINLSNFASTLCVLLWMSFFSFSFNCILYAGPHAGSIPNGVIGIFHWHNPSDRTMALGSTQPLTEMSTRSIS